MDHFKRCDLESVADTERCVRFDGVRNKLRQTAADVRRVKDIVIDSSEIVPCNIVRVNSSGQREDFVTGLAVPTVITIGPDGALYVFELWRGPSGLGTDSSDRHS